MRRSFWSREEESRRHDGLVLQLPRAGTGKQSFTRLALLQQRVSCRISAAEAIRASEADL